MAVMKTQVVLVDIEGTTTSIHFVKDVLFPYAKQHCKQFLEENWNDLATQVLVQDLLHLPQYKEFADHVAKKCNSQDVDNIVNFVYYLIDKDLKLAPLKTLQGYIWNKGYSNGSIVGHVYADVPRALTRWQEAGLRIAIYSSGSIKAQKLLFGQTEYGNLAPLISAFFDTSSGHKQEVVSYKNIAKDLGVDCGEVLFLTDVVKEAEAARAAGMHTAILNRPGNAPLTEKQRNEFVVVNDFDALKLHAS